jgi:peroxiredoxin
VSGYDVALKMRPGMTDRTSYVIAPSGRIAFVHSEMSYAGHVKSTLAAVEAMKGK